MYVCVFVRARVRQRVAMSSRIKRVDVCEECKVRGRRGSKRADRALHNTADGKKLCVTMRDRCTYMCGDRFLIISRRGVWILTHTPEPHRRASHKRFIGC